MKRKENEDILSQMFSLSLLLSSYVIAPHAYICVPFPFESYLGPPPPHNTVN